jgi:hypothetical protein
MTDYILPIRAGILAFHRIAFPSFTVNDSSPRVKFNDSSPRVKFSNDFSRACVGACLERAPGALTVLHDRPGGTPAFVFSNIYVPRHDRAQMIDFRIADPRANSCFPSHRFPVIYGSTTRPPGIKFSNACLGNDQQPLK